MNLYPLVKALLSRQPMDSIFGLTQRRTYSREKHPWEQPLKHSDLIHEMLEEKPGGPPRTYLEFREYRQKAIDRQRVLARGDI